MARALQGLALLGSLCKAQWGQEGLGMPRSQFPPCPGACPGGYSLRMFSTESFRNMTRFPIITWHTSSCNWAAEQSGLAGC